MLLERDKEMAQVDGALCAAVDGRSSMIVVTGPLGIGRSALLRGLAAGADGSDVRVLTAHAALMEQDFAFGVVRQLFDSLMTGATPEARRKLREEPDRFARSVFSGDDGTAGMDPGIDTSEATLHGLRSLLVGLCEETPLLILVDDLQWADVPSLRWLAYLAKRLRGLRIVLVCTLREGDPWSRYALVREVTECAGQTLSPTPLSLDATRVMIEEQFEEPGEEPYVRACHEVSAGNPLFLLSVLVGMAVSGYRPTAENAETARSLRPSGLRERLTGCIRAQTEPVRDLAAAIAVLGDHARPALVAQLAGLDDIGLSSALRVLYELGLLPDERTLRFTHRVVQDAVESSLTITQREDLHHSAAALLYEGGRPAEQVAAQLMAVTGQSPAWSTAVLRSAASTALRRGAPEIAARYLRRALLESTGQNAERARLLIDLATAERTFDPTASERHIAQALPMLPEVKDRAAAVQRMPPALFARPSSSMVELVRRTAEELGAPEQLDGTTRETALCLEARLRHYAQEDPAALSSSTERLRELGGEPPLDSGAERELAAVLLCSATFAGRLSASAASRMAGRILEREPADEARVHTTVPLAAITLLAADSVHDVETWLTPEKHPRRPVSASDEALLLAQRAMVHISRGRPAWAREHAERALRLTAPYWYEAPSVVLAAVALELGDMPLSEEILAGAGSRTPTGLALTSVLRILQASVHAQRGMRARALEDLLACGRQLESRGWHNSAVFPWRPRAIGLYERLGDELSAMVLADEEHSWAAAWGAPAVLGRALRLKGRLHGDRGIPMLRKAVEVLRSSRNELELARTLVLLGGRLGSRPEAEAALREGGELAAACGAPWLAKRAEDGLGAAPSQNNALTRSERKVVSLAGEGLTNQEIAKTLGVSLRAVEKHLTNSYRKIGVSGRAELAKVLRTSEFTHLRP
ncbi:helix-turn-helix transcriptional regulator [Streptomyces nanshensis]|uniref:LuxR family transcriptional regulator n=1 Tax=Streptomyces nanshensis TaxID=518642 RepID=A0A1E7L0E3_9ACTN|nr:LuxR family transcriptional regulator [Streptomyces nanshensis]OEV09632.1 LuxR family transcriptional regulator [Streptomyces nanshensis]